MFHCERLARIQRRVLARPARLRLLSRPSLRGFAIVEVVVAMAVLALTVVASTQALLHSNRQAAISRMTNAAKAEALSRIQQVSQCAFNPDALPPVVPTILSVGTTTETVDLGSETTDLGEIPGTVTWTVSQVGGSPRLLNVRCKVAYQYLGHNLSYELFTYKSSD
jgi:type II secretory pathway pseudopilin PulG